MTVKELKEKLEAFPDDTEVVIHDRKDPFTSYTLDEAWGIKVKGVDENGKVIDLPEYQGCYFPKKYVTVVSLFNYAEKPKRLKPPTVPTRKKNKNFST